MRATAIVFSGENKVEIETVNLRAPGKGEVFIETVFFCVSPGTELRCLRGKEKNAPAFPIVPGYSLTGTVVYAGKGVKTFKCGDTVFCTGTIHAGHLNIGWGGHISYAICREENIEKIPDGISMLEASTTALAAIAFHGVRLSRPQINEKVAVVGLGIIGRLSAAIYKLSGAEVVACDVSSERVAMAGRN